MIGSIWQHGAPTHRCSLCMSYYVYLVSLRHLCVALHWHVQLLV
uniref:Uncharacterized protein n=1 Tax=Setaria italica TaxID=4555 RepID=K4A3Q5_SETIT